MAVPLPRLSLSWCRGGKSSRGRRLGAKLRSARLGRSFDGGGGAADRRAAGTAARGRGGAAGGAGWIARRAGRGRRRLSDARRRCPGRGRLRRMLRAAADRLDRPGRGVSLSTHGSLRPVRHGETLGDGDFARPADASPLDRLQLRHVSGRSGRLRYSRGHLGRIADRPGLFAALRRGASPVGQHFARRLRRRSARRSSCWQKSPASTKWRSARWPAGN